MWSRRPDSHPTIASRRIEASWMHATQSIARATRVLATYWVHIQSERSRRWVRKLIQYSILPFYNAVLICWHTAICVLRQDAGLCRGVYNRFAFDWDLKRCVAFNYGGCRGNQNNFLTQGECESTCQRFASVSPSTQSPRRLTLGWKGRLIDDFRRQSITSTFLLIIKIF